MATWTDIERLTWDQLETFTWDQIGGLSSEQIARYVDDLWPHLVELSKEERRELAERIIAGTLPVLVADGLPRYSKVEQKALELWQVLKPDNSTAAAGWALVLLELVSQINLHCDDPPPPAPPTIIIQNIRPAPPAPPAPPQPRPPGEGDSDGPPR